MISSRRQRYYRSVTLGHQLSADRRSPHGYLRGAVEALHERARAEFEEMKRLHAAELEHAERQILALRRIVARQAELLDEADCVAVGKEKR